MVAGEEVTISYIGDLSDDVVARRHHLQHGWEFYCKCPRCETEAVLPRNIKELVANINDQMSEDKPGRILSMYRQGYRANMSLCMILCTYNMPS